jgi:Uma2 family endonuclease
MAVQFVQPHRFSVEQYRRMTEIGMVPEDGTELIDGVVVSGMRPHRFSSAEYFRLGEAGIIDEDERVELLDGEIIQMTPIGSRHSSCVSRLIRILMPLRGGAELRIQDVLHLREEDDPQPDAALYRPRSDDYEEEHPTAADALLVVEVADTSLLYDRTVKMERYAEAGVPEYWIVDLRRNVVIVSRNPLAGQFMDVREYGPGERWRSAALGNAEVVVDDIVGKPRNA